MCKFLHLHKYRLLSQWIACKMLSSPTHFGVFARILKLPADICCESHILC